MMGWIHNEQGDLNVPMCHHTTDTPIHVHTHTPTPTSPTSTNIHTQQFLAALPDEDRAQVGEAQVEGALRQAFQAVDDAVVKVGGWVMESGMGMCMWLCGEGWREGRIWGAGLSCGK